MLIFPSRHPRGLPSCSFFPRKPRSPPPKAECPLGRRVRLWALESTVCPTSLPPSLPQTHHRGAWMPPARPPRGHLKGHVPPSKDCRCLQGADTQGRWPQMACGLRTLAHTCASGRQPHLSPGAQVTSCQPSPARPRDAHTLGACSARCCRSPGTPLSCWVRWLSCAQSPPGLILVARGQHTDPRDPGGIWPCRAQGKQTSPRASAQTPGVSASRRLRTRVGLHFLCRCQVQCHEASPCVSSQEFYFFF